MSRPAWAFLAALALAPIQAAAAILPVGGGSVSYSIWTVDGATVRVRVMLPSAAARKLSVANAPPPAISAVASAVGQGVSVLSAGGDCEAIDQGEGVGQVYTLARAPGLDRFEIVFVCPRGDGLVLKDGLLFDQDRGHIDFAQIRVGAGPPVLQVFTHDRRSIALPAAGPPQGADPIVFARAAAMGLMTSLAGLAVLAGSVLSSRRWRDLAWLLGSLAAGYLASAALALTGLVTVDQALAAPMAGLLTAALGIGVVGGSMGAVQDPRWRWTPRALLGLAAAGLAVAAAAVSPLAGLATAGASIFALAALQAAKSDARFGALVFAPAALFAFLDGLSAAGDLALLNTGASQLAAVLVGHDLGGLAAAAAIAGAGMALIWLAGRRLRAWRGPASEVAGAALIGLGLFWFVTRLQS